MECSEELKAGARALVERSVEMAKLMVSGQLIPARLERGGRKAHQLDVKAQI